MKHNTEAERRLYMLSCEAILVVIHVFFIYLILHNVYNNEFRTQLYARGHFLVLGIYAISYISLGNIFGGLLIGARRGGEVMFSETFTALFANGIFYLMVMMYSFSFPTMVPVIGATAIQLVISAAFIKTANTIYKKRYNAYQVLLIYDGDSIDDFMEKLATRRDQLQVTATVSAKESLEEIFSRINKVHTVIIWDLEVSKRNTIFKYCYDNSKRIYMAPKLSDIIFNGSTSVHMFDTPLLLTEGSPLEYEERVIKRFVDIVLSLILIVLTSPLMLLTAIAVKLQDGGPVIYKQIRCTKNDREFEIMKFRSMIVDAEKQGARLARQGDDRITPVGRFIRKVRLDELPQLINVLKGDMSFVGPRPERPEFIKKYVKDMPEFAYRTKVQAGLTGYAQLYGKYNTRPYDKLKLDLYYIESYSLWLDFKLMILTAKILFTAESTEGVKE
jgi:exopolysaccharide biosynthesis polyprenyl glycosylphosphotransferase